MMHAGDETIDFSDAEAAIVELLRDLPDDITDLHVQGGKATLRRGGLVLPVDLGIIQIDKAIADIAALTASALGREIGTRSPILEQRIPPRYRVTCSHPSVTQDGHWLASLRLLADKTMPLVKWVEDGNLSLQDCARLMRLMEQPKTILVAGTMGSGKTTLLRSMIGAMPAEQRLIVIEDAAELNIDRPNTPSMMVSRGADLSALIAHGFRQDAERIVVGEIRDRSAMEFLTLASGGTRAVTTIHTEIGIGALVRLHWLVHQAGYHVTMEQVKAAIHAVVTVQRTLDNRRPVTVWEAD